MQSNLFWQVSCAKSNTKACTEISAWTTSLQYIFFKILYILSCSQYFPDWSSPSYERGPREDQDLDVAGAAERVRVTGVGQDLVIVGSLTVARETREVKRYSRSDSRLIDAEQDGERLLLSYFISK